MKSKLNKQQKKYIKACDSKELRKLFKKFFKKENRAWIELKNQEIVFKNTMFTTDNPFIIEFLNGLSVTQIEENKGAELIKLNSEYLNNVLENSSDLKLIQDLKVLCVQNGEYEFSAKFRDKEKQLEKATKTPNANSLTKETLESLTNPDLTEKKKDFENAIEEFLKPKLSTHLAWNKNGTNEIPLGGEIELEEPFKNLEFDLPKTSHDKGNREAKNSNFVVIPIDVWILEHIQKLNENKVKFDSSRKMVQKEVYRMILELEKHSGTKIYTEEDMFKCFQGARRMSKPLLFEFESFASYLESLQK